MDCNILNTNHWMLGIDLHDAICPPSPKLFPFMPHAVFMKLCGVTPLTVQEAKKVLSDNTSTCQRGTDMGPFIPHIFYNALIPVIMLGSGSISEFGAFTVLVQGNPVATACFGPVNSNLNCCDPVPLPLNIVLASTTNMAGMRFGDFVGSIISMAVDMAVQFLSNKISGGLGGGNIDPSKGIKAALARKATQWAIGIVIGSPVGFSIPYISPLSFWYGKLKDWALGTALTPSSPEPNTTPAAVNNMYNEGELINGGKK